MQSSLVGSISLTIDGDLKVIFVGRGGVAVGDAIKLPNRFPTW